MILLVLVIGSGFLAYFLWLKPAAPAPVAGVAAARTAKVLVGTLDRTIRIAGQTAARDFGNIIAPRLNGPESRNSLFLLQMVKSGTPVKKGDLLAQIDGQSARDHIDDTMDTVRQAENDVKKRMAEQEVDMENLLQSVRVARSEHDKAQWEAKASEVRTVVEQELLKLSEEEYAARYQQAQADLPYKKTAQASELRILEITLDRHRRHVNRHVVDIKKYDIAAPMDGLAVAQTIFRGGEMAQIQAGDQVFPGQPIMKVVNTASMQVEGVLNQAESEQLRLGQEAKITLDAFPGLEFKGKVYSIGALAVGGRMQNYYIRNIPIRVAIEGGDPRLIPDLSAGAEVVIESSEKNSTLAPLGGITFEGKKAFAFVKKGESFEKREVTLGMQNNTHAVVLAGLSAGDEIRLK